MSGEHTLWRYLANGMRGRWHAQRHEDKYTAGIPDVSYGINGVDGWIELKSLTRWPIKNDALIDVGLSREQAIWLTSRGSRGNGQCFILLRVGREHLLFPWTVAKTLVEKQTQNELYLMSVEHWFRGSIDFDRLTARLGG